MNEDRSGTATRVPFIETHLATLNQCFDAVRPVPIPAAILEGTCELARGHTRYAGLMNPLRDPIYGETLCGHSRWKQREDRLLDRVGTLDRTLHRTGGHLETTGRGDFEDHGQLQHEWTVLSTCDISGQMKRPVGFCAMS